MVVVIIIGQFGTTPPGCSVGSKTGSNRAVQLSHNFFLRSLGIFLLDQQSGGSFAGGGGFPTFAGNFAAAAATHFARGRLFRGSRSRREKGLPLGLWPPSPTPPNPDDLARAADRIGQARRIVVMAGLGAAELVVNSIDADGTRAGINGFGHYHDEYVREDGEWRITALQ